MSRLAIDRTTDIENNRLIHHIGHNGGDGRPVYAANTFEPKHPNSQSSSGIAGTNYSMSLTVSHKVKGDPHRGVLFLPYCIGSRILHTNYFAGMLDTNIKPRGCLIYQASFDSLCIPNQNNGHTPAPGSRNSTLNLYGGCVVSAHGVNGNYYFFLQAADLLLCFSLGNIFTFVGTTATTDPMGLLGLFTLRTNRNTGS